MAEKLLETKRTTPTVLQFTIALRHVAPELDKRAAGVLYAHFAGETGDGLYCWNWNMGNVKHVAGDGFDYVSLRGVWEGFLIKDEDGDGDIDENDKTILIERLIRSGMWILDPSKDHAVAVGPRKVSMLTTVNNPAAWFRAYPDIETGMAKFVAQKKNPGGRYFSAWQYVLAGNPAEYGRELGRKGYYTASQDAYAKSMVAKFDKWMAQDSWERSEQDSIPTPRIVEHPVVEIAVSASLTDTQDGKNDMLVPVKLDGVTWLVSPVYYAPIGIGEADRVAKDLGFELPTPALVDAIWRQADLKVPPHLMIRKHDGVHMDTPELHAQQAKAIESYIAKRGLQGLGIDYKLVAGAFKDVVRMSDGKLGIYGWHVDLSDDFATRGAYALGLPLHMCYTPGAGRVIQQPFGGHALAWRDYSQGLRLVKRA